MDHFKQNISWTCRNKTGIKAKIPTNQMDKK